MRASGLLTLMALILSTFPSTAADLVGSWEGQYFCNAPNPVGQLKLRIVNEDGRLVAHESYVRGSNSGTVVYRVENQAADQFRLLLDRQRTRGFDFSYHLDYRIFPDGSLTGRYAGHRNCQLTKLKSTSPRNQVTEKAPTTPKQADRRQSTTLTASGSANVADKMPGPSIETKAEVIGPSSACDDNAIRFKLLDPYRQGTSHIEFLIEPARAAALVPACEAAEKNAAGEDASSFRRRKRMAQFAAGNREDAIKGLMAMRDAGDHRVVWHLAALYYDVYLAERHAGRQTRAIEACAASLEHYRRAAQLHQSQQLPQGELIATYLAYMYSGGPYGTDSATAQYGDPTKAVEFGDRAVAYVRPEVMVAMAHLIHIFTYDYRTKYTSNLLARAQKSRIAWLQRAADAGHQPAKATLKSIADDERAQAQRAIDLRAQERRREEDELFKRTHHEVSDRNRCIRRERGTIFNTLTLRNACNETLTVHVCKRSVAGTFMRELANAWQMGQTYCETRTALSGYSIDTVYVPNVDNLLASVTLGSDQFTAFACSTSTIMRFGKCWMPGKPFMVALSDLLSANWKRISIGLLLLIALGAAARARKSIVPPTT